MSEQDFESIYRTYFQMVFRFFRMKGFSESEAMDLTQDTFYRVYKHWDGYQDNTSARNWVLTVASSTWKNKIRSIKTQKREGQVVNLEDALEPRSPEKNPETQTVDREKVAQLNEAMKQLPQNMRATLVLRIHNGLKYKEIAKLMGVSIDTVKKQLHEAKKRLKDILGPSFEMGEETP